MAALKGCGQDEHEIHLARILERPNLPPIHEWFVMHSSDPKAYFRVISKIIENLSTLAHKCSADMLQSMIFASLPLKIALVTYCNFCLTMLDNKYFKVFQDLLEFYLSNHPEDAVFAVGLIHKIASHPKTEYSSNFLEVL